MKLDPKVFRIRHGETVELSARATNIEPLYKSRLQYEKLLSRQKSELAHLQNLQYAHDRYALLVIFQAMDAAGKDGAIKHVMADINPAGCDVHSFQAPNPEELEHDFLWRATRRLPERGRIGIFNRSYYEEVLVVRVNKEFLRGQKLPEETAKGDQLWKDRYRSIVELERHLHANGTRIVKFFLHLSREEQRKRFLARIDDPDKNWKFNQGDLEARERWADYMEAYESCFEATSRQHAPWYVVPADDKRNARLIIAYIISRTLKQLKMEYPQSTPEHKAELHRLRTQLES